MNKKLMILPIIAVVVAIMGLNVWAVPGSQQNWVKIYLGDEDVTNNFDIEQIPDFSGAMAPSDWKSGPITEYQDVYDLIKKFDKNLTPDKFQAKVGYEITPKAGYTVSGSYKVVVQAACADNEVWVFTHGYAEDVAVGKGGKPTVSGITSFSPFYVFTATSKTSAQTGDFAPAYIAMIGVALVSCGAIFAVRAKKDSKATK